MNLKRAAARGAGWNLIENVGSQVITFLIFLILARLLTPDAFGIAAIATTILGFLWLFIEQGFASAIVQHPDPKPSLLSTAFWIGTATAVSLAVVVTVAAPYIADAYESPELSPVLRILTWAMCLPALVGVHGALLERDLKFRAQASRKLIASVGAGVVAVVMALSNFGIWSLVGKQVVEGVLDLVVVLKAVSWRPSWTATRADARHLMSFGSRVLGSSLCVFLVRRSDEFIIGLSLGSVALGYYAVGLRAVILVSEVALRAAQRTALPVFSRLQHDVPRQRRAYYAAIELAAVVACPTFLGLSVTAPDLCVALFGDKWLEAIPVMQILGLMGFGIAVTLYNGPVLMACAKPHWMFNYTAFQAVLGLLVSLVAVRWGLHAVAAAQVIKGYLGVPVSLWLMKRCIGAEPFKVLRQLAAPAFSSLLMVAVVFVLRRATPGLSVAAGLAASVVLGAVTYGLALAVLDRKSVARLVSLGRTALGRSDQPG